MVEMKYLHVSEFWPTALEELLNPSQGVLFAQWPRFSAFMGGMRPNELTLLCAPTGAGKTAFLSCIAVQLAMQNAGQFIAPVETGHTDFLIRMISCMEAHDFLAGRIPDVEHVSRVHKRAKETFLDKPIWFSTHDNRVDIGEMVNLIKFAHQEGAQVAILDNLNFFLNVTSSTMERAEMDNAMHTFVMLVKKIPIHVILVCHPRKTEGGRVESEFDIKGSSLAVQEASNVILFNRPTQKDIDNGRRSWTDRELVFKKIRKRGMNVNKPIWFKFNQGRYEEVTP